MASLMCTVALLRFGAPAVSRMNIRSDNRPVLVFFREDHSVSHLVSHFLPRHGSKSLFIFLSGSCSACLTAGTARPTQSCRPKRHCRGGDDQGIDPERPGVATPIGDHT